MGSTSNQSADIEISENGDITYKQGLVIPPHKTGNFQFTAQQNTFGYQVAKLRVHVERAIARIKIYEILDFVTHDLEHIPSL